MSKESELDFDISQNDILWIEIKIPKHKQMPLKECEIKNHLKYLNQKAREDEDEEYPVSLYQVVDELKTAKVHNRGMALNKWKQIADKFIEEVSNEHSPSIKNRNPVSLPESK